MAGSTELRLWRRKPSGSWGAVEQAEVEGEYGATVVRRGRVNQFMDKRYPSALGCFGPDPRTPIRPAACHGRNKAGHMPAPDPRAIGYPKIQLAPTGASTHVHDDDVAKREFRQRTRGA